MMINVKNLSTSQLLAVLIKPDLLLDLLPRDIANPTQFTVVEKTRLQEALEKKLFEVNAEIDRRIPLPT